MNHSSDNANVVTGTKRALESTQIGRETKVVTNTKQTPLTNMKKEETTNKLKNKNTSNKGKFRIL